MSTIDLVYFNAGGGHLASAQALSGVLQAQGSHWQVRLVNLFEVLDPQQRFRKLTGSAPEDWYNRRLARGWTLGMAQELKLLQGLIRLGHTTLVRRLQQHWLQTEPDLVVSLVPNFNRAMFESLASTLPGVPYATVLTDLADIPPHFWIERQPQHFICGSARAVAQALELGLVQADTMVDTQGPMTWGRFRIRDARGERIPAGVPARGTVWMSSAGMRTLGAKLGDRIDFVAEIAGDMSMLKISASFHVAVKRSMMLRGMMRPLGPGRKPVSIGCRISALISTTEPRLAVLGALTRTLAIRSTPRGRRPGSRSRRRPRSRTCRRWSRRWR